MFKKIVAIIAVFTISTFSSYWAGYSLGKDQDNMYKELDILAESMAIVEKKHVDEHTPQELVYGAMHGLMSSLDSYSQFLEPEDYQDLLTETEGSFGGLGIEITLKDNLLTVVTAMDDTPASKAGLESGDIIVKIDQELTKGITLNEAVKKLRGEPGTDVDITVLKDRDKSLEDIAITRAVIHFEDIKRATVLAGDVGYLKIMEFREGTAKELDKTLKGFKDKKIKGLIVDIRNNPGGLLYSSIEVASRFLETDKTVVSTRTRGEEEKFYKSAPGDLKILNIPMVVLINQGSASASEILAGALRENNRAVLVGETTFGKGSVQTVMPLSDGSALRLTTSKYYTPAGISIHEKGIDPDVEVALTKAYDVSEEIEKKIAENKKKKAHEKEVFDKVQEAKDSEPAAFDYTNDAQLTRALDLVKGLMVLSANK